MKFIDHDKILEIDKSATETISVSCVNDIIYLINCIMLSGHLKLNFMVEKI